MLRVERRAEPNRTPVDRLRLGYDDRKKSRLRARTEGGRDVAIVLGRGSVLRDGDLLAADSGEVLLVEAALERVSEVVSADPLALARAAYHLGNRHVPLQIELGRLRYQHDHVLDGLVRMLGLRAEVVVAAFEPEGGAYGLGALAGHAHAHDSPGEPASGAHSEPRASALVPGHGHAHSAAHDHDDGEFVTRHPPRDARDTVVGRFVRRDRAKDRAR